MPSSRAHLLTMRRRGYSSLLTVVMLVALCGIVSLGVEIGRVQTAKTELRTAADAAARAAAVRFLTTGVSAARQAATSAALDNTCDGTAVAVDSNLDVEFGAWDKATRVFTPLSGSAQNSADAVRVTARRSAARGNPIALSFARVIGRSSCDIQASSTVNFKAAANLTGFIGLTSVAFKDTALIASYNSTSNPNPTQFTSFTHGVVGSNGNITGGATLLLGSVTLGPSASVSGILATGSSTRLSSAITAPSMPAWNPSANPGAIPQNFTVSSARTLPGGTYYFTSLNIAAPLSFSGPATLYVNGDIVLDSSLTASNMSPSNLAIYQLGAHAFSDTKSSPVVIVAEITAPASDFTIKNNLGFYGSAFFNNITTKNDSVLFYDEQVGTAAATKTISTVK